MKYFLHDTNSFNDEKITELYIKYGYEGVGLFFVALEKIALQEKPIKTIVLKKQLNIGKKLEKIWKFMEEIDIISSNNGETFNERLLNFSEKYKIKKEKNKIRIANFRKKQEDVTHYKNIRNAGKVKESKVNNILQTEVCEEFNSEEYLKTLLENKSRHIRIIGKYALTAKLEFPNKKAVQDFIKTNVRFAQQLTNYSDEDIKITVEWLSVQTWMSEWKLSTILKYINNPKIYEN